jgi:hypothetical protein
MHSGLLRGVEDPSLSLRMTNINGLFGSIEVSFLKAISLEISPIRNSWVEIMPLGYISIP